MATSRIRILLRGVVALVFGLLFASSAIAAPFVDEGTATVAPAVAMGVAALALIGLAASAFALYGGSPARAGLGYRVARWGVWLIPVAGLGSGMVAWLASGDVAIMGIALWGTGLVWLVHLLLIRRHVRDMRLSGAAAASASGAV